jgi:endonuclease-3 related protein
MIYKFYKRLLKHYGKQNWWPVKSRNFEKASLEAIVGAVLTQRTNWRNAEKALENLRAYNLLDLKKLKNVKLRDLEELVRPSGFYKQKARRLLEVVKLLSNYKSLKDFFNRPVEEIRKELLSVKGIGRETADSILLYAGNKLIFPVDAYTFRIFQKLGLFDRFNYEEIRKFVEDNMPKNVKIYKEFHALLVRLGKDLTRGIEPNFFKKQVSHSSNSSIAKS